MNRVLISGASGALFGLGLAISGMANPARVLGYLDFFGDWDPTLMFVMGGAVLVMAGAWALSYRGAFAAPPSLRQGLDARLILGAVIFGAGWGLAGLCPGPAIVGLGFAEPGVYIFVVAMVIGLQAPPLVERLLARTATS